MVASRPEIRVDSEFARLRTVVVAQSEFRGPADRAALRHRPPVEPQAAGIIDALWGKRFGEVYPQHQAAWEAERDNLATLLAAHGAFRCSTQPLSRID
ncbi:hypothetical protein [Nocardia africana]